MKRILIVDDRQENRAFMGDILASQGYDMEQAVHGADALSMARQRQPDLVISDLLMPVMDGYSLLQEWRSDPALMHIPFIVYTATYTDEPDEQLALEMGATAFIRKPCSPERLIDAIQAILNAPSSPEGTPSGKPDEKVILKQYNEILVRKLEHKNEQLHLANQSLTEELAKRKQIEEELRHKNMVLKTQQEASLDAILLVGANNEILSFNQHFAELWGIPENLIDQGRDAPVLQAVADQAEDPEAFVSHVRELYRQTWENSRDEVLLKDGRVIDRYSSPITDTEGHYFGRVWFFRDITERRRYEQQLHEQGELLRQVSTMAKIGGWAFNPETGHGTWTEEVARIHDVDPSTMPNVSFGLKFYRGEDRAIIEQAVAKAIEHGAPYDLTLGIVSATGRYKYVRTMCNPVIRDGRVVEVRGAMQDVTEHKANEDRIRRLNRVLAILSRINMLIVRVKSREELFSESCRIAIEEGGLSMAMIAIVDKDTDRIIPVTSMGKDEELMEKVKAILSSKDKEKTMVARAIARKQAVVSNKVQGDSQVLFAEHYIENDVNSMAVLPLIVSGRPMGALTLYAKESHFFHQEEMHLLTELTDDIAFAIDHLEKQERIDYLSFYDELTGLANQRLFLDRIAQDIRAAQRSGHRLAIGLLDLERFKNINDSLGRSAGDSLLNQVAAWLIRELGDANLVARIDADHFAFVVPDIDSDEVFEQLLNEKTRAFMHHPFGLESNAVYRIGAKVGIAISPQHGVHADALYNKAEVALKKAKLSGDSYLFYSPKMDAKVAVKLSLENQLRQAIEREEFVLHYQPKIGLESGKVTGAEALIRWNKPDTGLLPPVEFVPLLEETGLIYEVGRWALRKAVTDYLHWRSNADMDGFRISVNVSPLQLRKADFIKDIERKVAIDAHAAAGLELELTESSIMENIRANIDTLQAIRSLGIHVTIDDFGTGFSSLSYLSKLPLDVLKIDREFIQRMTDGPEGLALVSTIINLANSLSLKVVAEGVERQEQVDLLRLLRCDEIQGFFYGRAIPADDFFATHLAPDNGA